MALLLKGDEEVFIEHTSRRFIHAKYQNHSGYTRDLPNQQPTWGFPALQIVTSSKMFCKILYFLFKII